MSTSTPQRPPQPAPQAAPQAAPMPLADRIRAWVFISLAALVFWSVVRSCGDSDTDRPAASAQTHQAAERLVHAERGQRIADGAAADAMRDYAALLQQGAAPLQRCGQAAVVLQLVQRTGRADLVADWAQRERADCAAAGAASTQR
jgi:hypothetical protein